MAAEGYAVPMAAVSKYDFRELEAYREMSANTGTALPVIADAMPRETS